MPKDGGNNEARLPFSPRDKSVSSNLGESVMSELEMPEDDKPGRATVIHPQLPHQQEPSESQGETLQLGI